MSTRPRPVGQFLYGRGRSMLIASVARISILLAAGAASPWPARANPQPESIQGVPQQIVPQFPEVGLGDFTIQTGTAIFGGSSGSGGSGSPGTGGGGGQTDSDSLSLMDSQSWGSAASANAQALGVNATALAATCQIESNCQNLDTATATSSVTGAFQMTNATYTVMLNAAIAQNPNLASSIVQGTAGQNDPATQSIAASEYLLQGAQALENAGVSNPTVLNVRGYYNFGPSGAALATADPSATMASVLSNTPVSVLVNNGVTPGETVAQWQAAVSARIGNAASAPVLA